MLTLYQHRPPEVGVPSENPRLDEPGVVITDFVDRVGDPVGIVAADGSTHRGEALLADALRALAYAATAGHPLPEATAVAYPAHWRPAAVDALRTALSRVPEWSGGSESLSLISDAEGALTALQTNPGLPIRGIVAVCDFGASGTSITLVDAANGYQPVGATVRHTDFSGELIDQALLAHIVADLSSAGSIDVSATSAIGSLTRLRAECRTAKQRLSASTATTLPADLPGFRGNIRLTRTELNEAINQPLDQLVHVLQDTLARNGIRATDLVAIASVGVARRFRRSPRGCPSGFACRSPRHRGRTWRPPPVRRCGQRAARPTTAKRKWPPRQSWRRHRHSRNRPCRTWQRCPLPCPHWHGRKPATNRACCPWPSTNPRAGPAMAPQRHPPRRRFSSATRPVTPGPICGSSNNPSPTSPAPPAPPGIGGPWCWFSPRPRRCWPSAR